MRESIGPELHKVLDPKRPRAKRGAEIVHAQRASRPSGVTRVPRAGETSFVSGFCARHRRRGSLSIKSRNRLGPGTYGLESKSSNHPC
jgi:hypothetical protein